MCCSEDTDGTGCSDNDNACCSEDDDDNACCSDNDNTEGSSDWIAFGFYT